MFRPNKLKSKIRNGERAYGTWLMSAEPIMAEIASHAGYDFLIFDNEHGPGDLSTTIGMLRAAQGTEVTCMVRASSHDTSLLSRMADCGVNSFLVPMVESAAQAKAIVDACLYPPEGKKGFAAGAVRASDYGWSDDYVAAANQNIFIALQIESVEAINQIGEIADVPGVDMIFIGPNDLSGSMGLLGQTAHPDVVTAVGTAIEATNATGKPIGSIPLMGDTFRETFAKGIQLVVDGADVAMYRMAMAEKISTYQNWVDQDDD